MSRCGPWALDGNCGVVTPGVNRIAPACDRSPPRLSSTCLASASSTCSPTSRSGPPSPITSSASTGSSGSSRVGVGAAARFRFDDGVRLGEHRDRGRRAPAPGPRAWPRRARQPGRRVHRLGARRGRLAADLRGRPSPSGPSRSNRFDRLGERRSARRLRRDWKRALAPPARDRRGGQGGRARHRRRRRARFPRSRARPVLNMLAPAMRPRTALDRRARARPRRACRRDLSACGEEEESEVVEGEPIEVAGLEYNVQITRFLNPDDTEDAEYLVGQPPAAARDRVPRRVHGDRERDRGAAAVGDRLHGRSTRSTRSTTLRREREPLRARGRRRGARRGPAPGPQHDRRDRAQPGLAADLPGRRRASARTAR